MVQVNQIERPQVVEQLRQDYSIAEMKNRSQTMDFHSKPAFFIFSANYTRRINMDIMTTPDQLQCIVESYIPGPAMIWWEGCGHVNDAQFSHPIEQPSKQWLYK